MINFSERTFTSSEILIYKRKTLSKQRISESNCLLNFINSLKNITIEKVYE